MSVRTMMCVGLMLAASGAEAAEFLIDDFDVTPSGRVLSRAITPDQSDPAFIFGDMFGIGDRDLLMSNGQPIPRGLGDDSIEPSAGETVFETDTQGVIGQAKDDAFFGVIDLLNSSEGGPNSTGTGSVEWTIDISGLSSLALSVDVGAMGDFEATGANADAYTFSASIDGGAFLPIMLFRPNEAIEFTYRPLDKQLADGVVGPTYNDPIVYLGADGVLGGSDDKIIDKSDPATGALDSIVAAFAGSGASMVLRFDASNDGGSEAFVFDNVKLLSDFVGGEFAEADFDEDGFVDADDLATWTAAYGSTNAGDANDDNVTDGADFLIWQRQFTGSAAVSAIPEPATALLGVGAAVGLFATARRRR